MHALKKSTYNLARRVCGYIQINKVRQSEELLCGYCHFQLLNLFMK